jgi:peptidyl-prolyl cis-trans isomerase-like 4
LQVSEGLEVLQAINEAFVDAQNRPLQNTRIRHTVVLDDPFPDPPQMAEHVPEDSPPPTFATEVPSPFSFPPLGCSRFNLEIPKGS